MTPLSSPFHPLRQDVPRLPACTERFLVSVDCIAMPTVTACQDGNAYSLPQALPTTLLLHFAAADAEEAARNAAAAKQVYEDLLAPVEAATAAAPDAARPPNLVRGHAPT